MSFDVDVLCTGLWTGTFLIGDLPAGLQRLMLMLILKDSLIRCKNGERLGRS